MILPLACSSLQFLLLPLPNLIFSTDILISLGKDLLSYIFTMSNKIEPCAQLVPFNITVAQTVKSSNGNSWESCSIIFPLNIFNSKWQFCDTDTVQLGQWYSIFLSGKLEENIMFHLSSSKIKMLATWTDPKHFRNCISWTAHGFMGIHLLNSIIHWPLSSWGFTSWSPAKKSVRHQNSNCCRATQFKIKLIWNK